MAIVPRSQESRRLSPSTPVPIASTNDARLMGSALEGFGGGVQKLGEGMMHYEQKIQAQEDKANTDLATNELQNLHQRSLDTADNSASPDGSNMGDIYNENYEKNASKLINNIQSPKVRKNVENFNRLLNQDAQTKIQVTSLAKKQTYVYDTLGKNANLVSDRIRMNPNEALVAAEFSNFNATIDDPAFNTLDAKQKLLLKNGTQKMFAQSLVDGFEAKQQYGRAIQFLSATQKTPDVFTEIPPNQAAELGLIGRDEAGQLSQKGENYKVPTLTDKKGNVLSPQVAAIANSLPASEKAHMLEKLQAKIQEKTSMRLGDLNAQLNGMERLGLAGETLDPKGVAQIKQEINSNPNLTDEARVRLFDKVNSITSVNKTLQTIKSLPRSQWQGAIDKMDANVAHASNDAANNDPRMKVSSTDFASLAERQQHREVAIRQLSEIQKAQDRDAAAFVQEDPQIALLRAGTKDGDPAAMDKYVQSSLSKQAYLGIPTDKQRILSKQEAQTYASQLASLPRGEDAAEFMNGLQAQYGPNFNRVFKETVSENKNLESLQIAAYMDDTGSKAKVFENVRNKKAIIEGMNSNDEAKVDNKILDSKIGDKMEDFRGILSNTSEEGIGVSNGFQEQLQLEVKKRYQADPMAKKDPEKLVDDAYKDLVEKSYSVVNSATSKVLIPKQVDGKSVKTENVRAFLNVYGKGSLDTLGSFNDLSVGVPATYKKEFGEDAKNRWYKDLRMSSRWISNGDQSGLKLMHTDPSGILIPVLDQNGNPVEKSLLDITFKPSQRVLDAQKSMLERLFR